MIYHPLKKLLSRIDDKGLKVARPKDMFGTSLKQNATIRNLFAMNVGSFEPVVSAEHAPFLQPIRYGPFELQKLGAC